VVQADGTAGEVAGGAVTPIAEEGQADAGELGADLVVASGEQGDLEECQAGRGAHQAVLEDGLAGLAAGAVDAARLVRVMHQPVLETARGRRRPAGDDGPVELRHLALALAGVQPAEGFAGAGEEDYAADRAVDAVDGFQEDGPGLVEGLLDPCLGAALEAVVVGVRGLGHQPRRLVDGQEVVIDVEDIAVLDHPGTPRGALGRLWPCRRRC